MDYKYFPHTEDDLAAMLAKVGVKDLDGLYAQIPESIRFRGDYDIPSEMSEMEVRETFKNPFHLMHHKRPHLALKNNTPQHQPLHHTPNTPRNINPIAATLPTQYHSH